MIGFIAAYSLLELLCRFTNILRGLGAQSPSSARGIRLLFQRSAYAIRGEGVQDV